MNRIDSDKVLYSEGNQMSPTTTPETSFYNRPGQTAPISSFAAQGSGRKPNGSQGRYINNNVDPMFPSSIGSVQRNQGSSGSVNRYPLASSNTGSIPSSYNRTVVGNPGVRYSGNGRSYQPQYSGSKVVGSSNRVPGSVIVRGDNQPQPVRRVENATPIRAGNVVQPGRVISNPSNGRLSPQASNQVMMNPTGNRVYHPGQSIVSSPSKRLSHVGMNPLTNSGIRPSLTPSRRVTVGSPIQTTITPRVNHQRPLVTQVSNSPTQVYTPTMQTVNAIQQQPQVVAPVTQVASPPQVVLQQPQVVAPVATTNYNSYVSPVVERKLVYVDPLTGARMMKVCTPEGTIKRVECLDEVEPQVYQPPLEEESVVNSQLDPDTMDMIADAKKEFRDPVCEEFDCEECKKFPTNQFRPCESRVSKGWEIRLLWF